ncbi:transglutaminase-like domain-containing protein, partial [Clostridium sporogenes]
FIAMCRANDIKVRLITGEGFNGVSWVSHAWNQVYIPEEGRWINVDTTFYKGGNYFDTKRFDIDHRKSQIAGEW